MIGRARLLSHRAQFINRARPLQPRFSLVTRRSLFGFGKKEAEDALAAVTPENKEKLKQIAAELQQMMFDAQNELQNRKDSDQAPPNPMDFLTKLQAKAAEAEQYLPAEAREKMKGLANMVSQGIQDLAKDKDGSK